MKNNPKICEMINTWMGEREGGGERERERGGGGGAKGGMNSEKDLEERWEGQKGKGIGGMWVSETYKNSLGREYG